MKSPNSSNEWSKSYNTLASLITVIVRKICELLLIIESKKVLELRDIRFIPDISQIFNSLDMMYLIEVLGILIFFLLLFSKIGEPYSPLVDKSVFRHYLFNLYMLNFF